jgi:hypothetical protein
MREVIQTTLDRLQEVAAKLDEIEAKIALAASIEASLVNVRAKHDKAFADMAEGQRQLEAARAAHAREMSAMEASVKVAKAKVFGLVGEVERRQAEINDLRRYHDELLASIQSLKRRLHA